jgi:hypothetical protein
MNSATPRGSIRSRRSAFPSGTKVQCRSSDRGVRRKQIYDNGQRGECVDNQMWLFTGEAELLRLNVKRVGYSMTKDMGCWRNMRQEISR